MEKTYTTEEISEYPIEIFLDKQKDIRVRIYENEDRTLSYRPVYG